MGFKGVYFSRKCFPDEIHPLVQSGDVYMVASGIPERNGNRHITCIAELSLDLIKTMGDLKVPQLKGERLLIRIGFCTGILDEMFSTDVS